jgi:hypothetical protein
MAKKTNSVEPAAKKEKPQEIFEAWFKSCTEVQKKVFFELDSRLGLIQTGKKDMRRETQPLRLGMELQKAKAVITGRAGKADPQKEEGRIWGAYRDSRLKAAGFSKSSCETYVTMIAEARKILPDDNLIITLLDHTNEKGVVMMTGGKKEKPFGPYTMYLQSDDVQKYVKDGKVDLEGLSAEDLVANVFDPENVETPDPKLRMTVAVNTVVKQLFAELKSNVLPRTSKENPLVDEEQVVKHSHRLVQYVVESLLTACAMQPIPFSARTAEHLKDDEIVTLSSLVHEANAKKTKDDEAKPKAKKAKKAKATHVREYEQQYPVGTLAGDFRPEGGKYVIRVNPKSQFPRTPWEVWEDGKDKPVARCQDKLQATDVATSLLSRKTETPSIPTAPKTEDELATMQDDLIRQGVRPGSVG